ncbi:MAG TPA: glycine cleavage system protein GcvH [Terrimesophilobacter sp.]|mgnify:CR=1 FL=1|nr:glycine cleavage system protein GcvH [Terrimesophilobacter sp.]HRQ00514.1 glycine cleavage system protein GcvH [Terrimesophilobacter sp.]
MADTANLKYTKEHEWLAIDGATATIGITQFAADQLGDVVYIELPKVGATVEAGKVVGEIESTKSVGELFAPVSGTIAEANDAVVEAPELVNDDPYGDGWLVKLTVDDAAVFDGAELLSKDEYDALVAE